MSVIPAAVAAAAAAAAAAVPTTDAVAESVAESVAAAAVPIAQSVAADSNPLQVVWSELRSFELDQVGLTVSAVEMVMGAAMKNREEARCMVKDLTKASKASTDAAKYAKASALLARKHTVPGFDAPTPLVTFQEAMQLIRLLPAKHTAHIIGHIDNTFQGVEAGDPRVQQRIAENAESNSPVARLARDGLGLPVEAALANDMEYPALTPQSLPTALEQSVEAALIDTEERALKRRRLFAEMVSLEMQALRETKAAITEVLADHTGALGKRDRVMLFDMLRRMAFGKTTNTNGSPAAASSTDTISSEIIARAGMPPIPAKSIPVVRKGKTVNMQKSAPNPEEVLAAREKAFRAWVPPPEDFQQRAPMWDF